MKRRNQMRKNQILAICLLCGLVMVLAVSCSGPVNTGQKGYFPLKAGNEWIYDTEIKMNMEGQGENNRKMDLIFKVTGTEKLKKKTKDGKEVEKECFVYQCFTVDKGVEKSAQAEYFETNSADLLCHKRVLKRGNEEMVADLEPSEIMLKMPLEVGKTWIWEGIIGKDPRNGKDVSGSFNFKVASKEDVETPMGKFKTLRIDMAGKASDQSTIKTTRWLADGVGIVKEVNEIGALHVTATLKSFKFDGKTYTKI
jgi:hypothetical protein